MVAIFLLLFVVIPLIWGFLADRRRLLSGVGYCLIIAVGWQVVFSSPSSYPNNPSYGTLYTEAFMRGMGSFVFAVVLFGVGVGARYLSRWHQQ